MNNYRPIFLISNFAKYLRLIQFIEKNKLLSKHRYGFRPGIGIENALFSMTQFFITN